MLYQQNHCGVYRSDDAGLNWYQIDDGLPATGAMYAQMFKTKPVTFGFPCTVHPQDPDTVFVVPVPDDTRTSHGKFAIWRTRNGGKSWKAMSRGLPQTNAYLGVLREGLSNDELGGIYCATSTGQVFFSRDDGDSWETIADGLPVTNSVDCAVV